MNHTTDGTIRAATKAEAIGGVFKIGTPREVTIMVLAQEVRRMLGSRSAAVLEPYWRHYGRGFEDTRRRVSDLTSAREVLGDEARVDLADGLARTIAWCRQNYPSAVSP